MTSKKNNTNIFNDQNLIKEFKKIYQDLNSEDECTTTITSNFKSK